MQFGVYAYSLNVYDKEALTLPVSVLACKEVLPKAVSFWSVASVLRDVDAISITILH